MHSSTSSFDFERAVPAQPWSRLLLTVAVLTAGAVAGWEFWARQAGYGPTLDDTPDLWAEQRAALEPDSLVLIGTSRMLFDIDLDVIEQGLGRRPIQLSIAGSSPYPVLADLAADERFHGTVLLDIVPMMFLAPGGMAIETSERALQRYQSWNYAQRWSHHLGVALEHQLAFINQEDLRLAKLLERLPIADRAGAKVMPRLPPYFYSLDRTRRARMVAEAAQPGSPLHQEITDAWRRLFALAAPPPGVPPEQFQQMMAQLTEPRYAATAEHIRRIRARGGRVVFLRLPVTGPLVAFEEQVTPRAVTWDRLVRENAVPAIHFAEHEDLRAFECPEWSHLSAEDSVEFTRRLVPHLQAALREPGRDLRLAQQAAAVPALSTGK